MPLPRGGSTDGRRARRDGDRSAAAAVGYRFRGRWLRQAREALGVSAEDVAALLGVELAVVNAWESETLVPLLVHVPALCEAYRVSAHELLERVTTPIGSPPDGDGSLPPTH
ncbi:MAG: helix-turn-helix domain-containing protein [Planctomycetes bacterium]|nr:helix-turn-helix domain-containing protein [Planctomycetota bacterium]